MVEDIVSTGVSSRECIAAIKKMGAKVVAACCLIDRFGRTGQGRRAADRAGGVEGASLARRQAAAASAQQARGQARFQRTCVSRLRLGVNVDHVATVRQARGGDNPDPVRAAILAQSAGADGITAHLREDRRHISDDDIARLSQALTIPLNLEMAATDEMAAIALRAKPHAACIVPEKREERTTEGGSMRRASTTG